MFEDIFPTPQPPVSKRLTAKPRFRFNLKQKLTVKELPKSLVEQIKDIDDLRQLIQILEVAKTKVRRKKLKQRKNRKEERKKKWEN